MKEFKDLTASERAKVAGLGHEFWDNHTDHVNMLIDNATACYAPSGSDMFHPELWKEAHWLWFFNLFPA